MIGHIHSTESFGTVDGPGIRYVVFMQGCPMRCLYCHNPDTWPIGEGKPVTEDDILREYRKNRSFYRKGGLTVSGGEPLLQVDFLLALFRKAKEENIHTCIDTSGITFREEETEYRKKLDELMNYTDLVLLDIKHIRPDKHRELTGQDQANILLFARYLAEKNIPVCIRHVVVPGYTDDPDDLRALGASIATWPNVKALDVLPYHTLGVAKYRELGIDYPLKGVDALTLPEAAVAKEHILEGIRQAKAHPQQSGTLDLHGEE